VQTAENFPVTWREYSTECGVTTPGSVEGLLHGVWRDYSTECGGTTPGSVEGLLPVAWRDGECIAEE